MAITGAQKSNFSDCFKLEPITTYYLGFVVKVMRSSTSRYLLQILSYYIGT